MGRREDEPPYLLVGASSMLPALKGKHDACFCPRDARTEGMPSFINVQTGVLVYDISFDVVGHALTATSSPAAWVDRDTGL